MPLTSFIQKEVDKALVRGGYIDDIPIRFTYFPVGSQQEFDPVSQETGTPFPGVELDGVFGDYRNMEVDGDRIRHGDQKVFISELSRLRAGVSFEVDGLLVVRPIDLRGNPLDRVSHWKIVRVNSPVANALYILQVREVGVGT